MKQKFYHLIFGIFFYSSTIQAQVDFAFESSYQYLPLTTEKNSIFTNSLNSFSNVTDLNSLSSFSDDFKYVNSTNKSGYILSFSFSSRFEKLKILNYFDLGFYGGDYSVGGGLMGINVGLGHYRKISKESDFSYRLLAQYFWGFDYSFNKRVRLIATNANQSSGVVTDASLKFPSFPQISGGLAYEIRSSKTFGVIFFTDIGYAFMNANKLTYHTNTFEGGGDFYWISTNGGGPIPSGDLIEVHPDNLEYNIKKIGGLYFKIGLSFSFRLLTEKISENTIGIN